MDAEEAVSEIVVSNDNYKLAKTLLKERFEDKELVRHTNSLELIIYSQQQQTKKYYVKYVTS